MKHALLSAAIFAASSWSATAATLDNEHIDVLGPVAITLAKDSSHKSAALTNLRRSVESSSSDSLTTFDGLLKWQDLSDDYTAAGLTLFRFTLSTKRFTQGHLTVSGADDMTLYVGDESIAHSDKGFKLALPQGEHELLLIAEKGKANEAVSFGFEGMSDIDEVTVHDGDMHRLSAQQLFDSETVSDLTLSDNGQYVLMTFRHYDSVNGDTPIYRTELRTIQDNQRAFSWQGRLSEAQFTPNNDGLVFVADGVLTRLDLATMALAPLSAKLDGASGFTFIDDNNLLFSWSVDGKDDGKLVKRYRALEDRWAGWRDNNQVFQLQLNSGLIRQLTDAPQSSYLNDYDATRNAILVTRNIVDYAKPPHGLTQLVEVSLVNGEEREIGRYRTFNGAQYGQGGIVAIAGPNFANQEGLNVAKGLTANDYDGQLFWMNMDGGEIRALSRDFDPAISDVVIRDNDDIVVSASVGDEVAVYQLVRDNESFMRITPQVDVINDWAVSESGAAQFVYSATSVSEPQGVFTKSVNGERVTLWHSKDTDYVNTLMPSVEPFDVVNKDGATIQGRVYLPNDFDKSKQYPALVYYYGGTAPVTRGFTGRYPFNLWAANGYVVYVLQPTGTYGYGQDFSAKHVNAWGDYAARDIIDSSKAFLDAYPMVDRERVGHLGASYGGFMTMWLATQTDMFAASVSHAGISNLTSYWGEGWWGALYSGVASRGSFPWNNPSLYSEHSPVFYADKVSNPMLLIHGDADINVPPGESQTMYTALKLLGKDVELVEFKGDNHHILAREKVFVWWATIMSYFDKHLKQEPQWWDYLYPPIEE